MNLATRTKNHRRGRRAPGGTNERTCVGTGQVRDRGELIRWFADGDGASWPDWTGRTSGRVAGGVYTLQTPAAIRAAAERRRLHGSGDDLITRARVAGEKEWFARVGLANRAGVAAVGQKASRVTFPRSPVAVTLVAEDAGETTKSRFATNSLRKGVPLLYISSGELLGSALGRTYVSVALVTQSAFGGDLVRWGRALSEFPGSCVTAAPEKGVDAPEMIESTGKTPRPGAAATSKATA